MKLGILGDIHGNLAALEAAHDALLAQGAERVFHLGDLGGYAPYVNEVVGYLRQRGVQGVQGNYDYNVAADAPHCGCRYDNPAQAEIAQRSFDWTKANASGATMEFMRSLPRSIKLEAHGRIIEVFHATPHKNNIYWRQDRTDKFFLEMAAHTEATVLVYGHTHVAYRRDMGGRVFINAGSVGKPKDGDPRACAALLEIDAENVASRFLRIAYDIEATARGIEASGLPVGLAQALREGR